MGKQLERSGERVAHSVCREPAHARRACSRSAVFVKAQEGMHGATVQRGEM
jgi:hypothetical protein